MSLPSKFEQQESLYAFPYHYIPHFSGNGRVSLQRRLSWGFEYLCYQLHIKKAIEALNPGSVLEVGCGDGYLIGSVNSNVPRRLGVDLSSRAIAFARAFNPHCEFAVENAENLTESFDVVAAVEVLEHVPDTEVAGFLRALEARLKPGGCAIVSVPTTNLPLNSKHFRHYDLALFQKQLEASGVRFRIDKVEYVFRSPAWMRAFSLLSENPLYCLEFKPMMGWIWRHIWSKCRVATARDAHHLVVHMRHDS